MNRRNNIDEYTRDNYHKIWYQKNKEQIKIKRNEDKEKMSLYQKQYRDKNKIKRDKR